LSRLGKRHAASEQYFMPKSERFCEYPGADVIDGIVDAASLSMVLLGIFYIEGKETDDFIQG
jgi:hypothetical protein